MSGPRGESRMAFSTSNRVGALLAILATLAVSINAMGADAEPISGQPSEQDRARAETLAAYSGRSVADIERIRIDALTWEATAREIGVHPSVIGIELIDARPPSFDATRP